MNQETLAYEIDSVTCEGVLLHDAAAWGPAPLLLVAPNWLGVTPRSVETASELAARGFVVLVADMYGKQHRPKGDENPTEFIAPLVSNPPLMRMRINGALEALTRKAVETGVGDPTRRSALGYCVGGTNVLELARSGADIAAVVSMHGNLTTRSPAEKGICKAAVMAIHGADDPIAPKADRDAFETEMRGAGAHWSIFCVGGVHHSFTDKQASKPPVSQYSPFASRYGYALANAFIHDAFDGRL
jgi:dienelactone hydrolase